MLEPISLRFDSSREKEAASRRHWCERPEASLCHRRANVQPVASPRSNCYSTLPQIYYVWSAETDELFQD